MKVVILTITKRLFVVKFLFLGSYKCKSVAPQQLEKRSVRKYYRKNKKIFWVPEKMSLSHIMFIEESDSSVKERKLQKKKAEEILRRIQAGENFSELAKKYSDDVSAHSGGQLGVVSSWNNVA